MKYTGKEYKTGKCYVYTINFNGIPIYVGSTNNIKEREKSHCSNLCKEYKIDWPINYKSRPPVIIKNMVQELYKFHKKNNISKIELNVVLEFDNDIIIGDKITDLSNYININIPSNIITKVNSNLEIELYHSNEVRYIEEERIIRYCHNKGLKLFNLVYPTINNYDTHNNIEPENIKKINVV